MTIEDIDLRRGPRAKVERAKVHLTEFKRLISEYIAAHPYEFIRQAEPDGGYQLIMKSHKPISVDLCPIIGDVVHNCRSALDQLVSISAGLEANTTEHFTFHIFSKRADFEAKALNKLRKYGCIKTARFVERLKPYERGLDLGGHSNTLVLLNRLSTRDKHRLIVPVGTAAGYAVVTPKPGFGEPFKLVPDDHRFLKDGEVIITISPKDPLFAGKRFDTSFTTEIRLFGIEPIPPISVTAYLGHIVKIVGRIVGLGERYLLRVD